MHAVVVRMQMIVAPKEDIGWDYGRGGRALWWQWNIRVSYSWPGGQTLVHVSPR